MSDTDSTEPNDAAQTRVTALVADLATTALADWNGKPFPNCNLRHNVNTVTQAYICGIKTEEAALQLIVDILRCWVGQRRLMGGMRQAEHGVWNATLGPAPTPPSELHLLADGWLKQCVWENAASRGVRGSRQLRATAPA